MEGTLDRQRVTDVTPKPTAQSEGGVRGGESCQVEGRVLTEDKQMTWGQE